jgi:transposase
MLGPLASPDHRSGEGRAPEIAREAIALVRVLYAVEK